MEIWPDQIETVDTFRAMLSQWRMGQSGPVGLDYTALHHVMDWLGVAQDDRADVFQGIRIMEMVALRELRRH